MKESQLQKLSYKELLQLQQRVAAVVARRKTSERAALKEKLQSIAEEAGFRIDDLFDKAGERAAASVAIKYRHPTNRSLIWTGRGRRPKWLVAEGGDVERFRVA
ncbi:MAG: H-NS histone family protein [Hyphomicrobiaceae bacterium]|nr:H-NS histone family protein [Hyphomicrobiaceae bacterium]